MFRAPADSVSCRAFPPGWFAQAAVAATIGIVVAGSFLIEIFGFAQIGAWTRAATIVIYIAAKMPFRGRSFLADSLRAGIIWIAIGFTVLAFLPVYRVGALHIVFITGFALVALTVAIRVVFGHSGRTDLLQKPLRFFIAAIVLLVLAMISRFTADLAPGARILHLLGAAICGSPRIYLGSMLRRWHWLSGHYELGGPFNSPRLLCRRFAVRAASLGYRVAFDGSSFLIAKLGERARKRFAGRASQPQDALCRSSCTSSARPAADADSVLEPSETRFHVLERQFSGPSPTTLACCSRSEHPRAISGHVLAVDQVFVGRSNPSFLRARASAG